MRVRSTALAAAALGAAVLLAGCASGGGSPSGASSTPVAGGTLRYASGDAEPTCLDPHVGGNYPQALVASQYLEPLVGRDASGAIIPWLATSWTTSPDGLSWDFTLKDGVTFHDGTPFDAAAVRANVLQILDPATKSSTGYLALAKVADVEVVDRLHARFHLSAPDAALLESLSQPWTAMESPAGMARGVDANCLQPYGTGPFEVSEWVHQDHITLTRYDGYASPPADAAHQGPAYLDSILWRFIPDAATRYAALQSGEVDIIDNAQPDTVAQAQQHPSAGIVALQAPRPGASNRIEFNGGQGPFTDQRVREAFIRAVDVDAGVKSLFFGTAPRSYSPLSSVEPDAYSAPDDFPYDPAAAAKLLDEAGWTPGPDGIRVKDGQRLVLRFPVSTNQSIPAEQSLFQQFQASAKQLGFDVQISLLDLSSWYAALAAHEYDLVSAPYTKVGPDVLRILYDTEGITPAPSGYFANLAQVSIPELDQLLSQASATLDTAQRAQLYQQAQKIILDQARILPLYDQQNNFLYRSDVHGVRALATVSTPTFLDAWVSKGS